MNIEFKKGTTALGMMVTIFVLVIVNLVKLGFWFMREIAKAIQTAAPEIKAQIAAAAPNKADEITDKVRLRLVGVEDEESEVKAS
ncbi:MAG TPA: hypothetical protein VJ742_12520 [Nitrososphaera sp.]|nr:hypothetical protein [Nitrososphaera sp.]